MIGEKFGKWTVVAREPNRKYGQGSHHSAWRVRCECGEEEILLGQSLRSGRSFACRLCRRAGNGQKPFGSDRKAWEELGRVRDSKGLARGDIKSRSVKWLMESQDRKGLLVQIKAMAGEYREHMREKCPPDDYPPCMGCSDLTVAFCDDSGLECREFHSYCCNYKKEGREDVCNEETA